MLTKKQGGVILGPFKGQSGARWRSSIIDQKVGSPVHAFLVSLSTLSSPPLLLFITASYFLSTTYHLHKITLWIVATKLCIDIFFNIPSDIIVYIKISCVVINLCRYQKPVKSDKKGLPYVITALIELFRLFFPIFYFSIYDVERSNYHLQISTKLRAPMSCHRIHLQFFVAST